jgi:3-hydroxyacyl-CoA dehydrogenase
VSQSDGARYIGHLYVQQFALAGLEVRVWSPGASAGTLHSRLRTSLDALAAAGLIEPSSIDETLARVSVPVDLATALAPCAAAMESIAEDADVKAACYRDIEAAIAPDVPVARRTVSAE